MVADDAEIRRLLTASHIVTEKLGAVSEVRDMPALVQSFKVSGWNFNNSIKISVADIMLNIVRTKGTSICF